MSEASPPSRRRAGLASFLPEHLVHAAPCLRPRRSRPARSPRPCYSRTSPASRSSLAAEALRILGSLQEKLELASCHAEAGLIAVALHGDDAEGHLLHARALMAELGVAARSPRALQVSELARALRAKRARRSGPTRGPTRRTSGSDSRAPERGPSASGGVS